MKSIVKLIAVVCMVTESLAQSPNIQWQHSLGGTNDDQAAAVIQTRDGGYVVAGRIDSYDGDVQGFYAPSDIWLVKLDSTGTVIQWQKNLGGSSSEFCESIEETTDGGFILCGQTSSNDGDVSGLHCWNPPCPFGGIPDIWVVRTDSIGNPLYQKCLGGTDGEEADCIQQTTDGGFILIGFTNSIDSDVIGNHGNNGAEDIWVVKLDTTLNIQWSKCYGGTGAESGSSIQQTLDGGYIMCGWTFVSNDGDVSGNHGLTDAWVVKINSSGVLQWQKCYGGSMEDGANSISSTIDGGYIFTGGTNSNDIQVSGNHGSNDYWVVKIDSIGGIQWQKCFGGSGDDIAQFVQTTSDNCYLICGGSISNDGDITGNNGDEDFWIIKVDSLGNLLWQRSAGGTLWEEAYQVRETSDGGSIVAGYSASLDGDIVGHHGGANCNGSSYPCEDYWVVKLAPVLSDGVQNSFASVTDLSTFMNQDKNIQLNFYQNKNERTQIRLLDVTGRELFKDEFSAQQGQNKRQIAANNLSSGLYLINLSMEEGSVTKKLIVQ
jgi:hypothetical protein